MFKKTCHSFRGPGLSSYTLTVLTTYCNSSSKGTAVVFWPLRASDTTQTTHGAHTHGTGKTFMLMKQTFRISIFVHLKFHDLFL